MLHLLGYLYGRHGQVKRGTAYLLIAAQLEPANAEVLQTLAHLLVLGGEAGKALTTIERLEELESAAHPALALLKGRALLAAGRPVEARRSFQDFLAQRELNDHA
ncbi:hypothetical protein J8I29_18485 [Labrys sp. LIt4]|uniref:Uncharacterized protein n=1 Tax=Labrys okinawensis TaxID=346911 RepID=A0A2S9QK02_9HYPH|nr:hypothetical protein [Labrys sp. LIt4]MBP0581323.1 hypothetical protein [Labrys sp. LIt4]PRH89684.1 hypothetical protein C5L14_01905 [Labrys okinawensis]